MTKNGRDISILNSYCVKMIPLAFSCVNQSEGFERQLKREHCYGTIPVRLVYCTGVFGIDRFLYSTGLKSLTTNQ